MRNEKKSKNIHIRTTPSERQAIEGAAKLLGQELSDYVRLAMIEGGKVLMRERLGGLVDGKYGKVCEITTDTGHTYHVSNAVYKTRNHVVVFDAEYRMVGRPHVDGEHPLLNEIFDVAASDSNFDGAAYRALFQKLGLDPDNGRPAFNDADTDLLKALEWRHVWPGDDGRDNHELNELANEISELLRVDQAPGLKVYCSCEEALLAWPFTTDVAPFQKAFERVDHSRLTFANDLTVEIDVLPSWAPLEIYRLIEPRLYIEVGGKNLDLIGRGLLDGWPSKFAGIMEEPVIREESYPDWARSPSLSKIWNLGRQRVRDRLEQDGVVFLSKDEAADYVQSEEAVYWRWTQRGNSAWNNPAYARHNPRPPTWAEWIRWQVKAPDTPIHDRVRQPQAAAAE